MISHEDLDQLRSISVVEVAKALGIVLLSNNKAMCFAGHDKKTPSLSFNTRKNYWKCFGCGKGGDNIQLVIEVKNITFKQAVEWFRDNNIISHQNFDEKSKYLPKKIQRSFISHKTYNDSKIVKSDPEVYRWIINNSTLSEKSQTYLHKRGFKEETIEKFKIRDLFSANKFFSVLRERWGNKRLQRCGLLPLKDTKHKREYVKPAWWDYSLWFPFTSEDKIVYLQRRRFSANGPKYVNLYGLSKPIFNSDVLSSVKLTDNVYICEGIPDTIMASQIGWAAIGVLGATSVNRDLINLLFPYRVIVIPDNDLAGEEFFCSLQKMFLQKGKIIQRLNFAGAKDFADYVNMKLKKK